MGYDGGMSRFGVQVAQIYTYFMQVGRDGLVKIGQSWDVFQRRDTLAVEVRPEELYVLGVLRGKSHERRLQRKLKAHKAHGEWFYPAPEVMAEAAKAAPITRTYQTPLRNAYRTDAIHLLLSAEERADIMLVFEREGEGWRSTTPAGMIRQMFAEWAHEIRMEDKKKGGA